MVGVLAVISLVSRDALRLQVLMLRRVLLKRKVALYVVPFVALAASKVQHFDSMYNGGMHIGDAPVRVNGFFGSASPALGRTQVGVCSIEKASVIVNECCAEGRMSKRRVATPPSVSVDCV
jgi:hypothetical protein